MKPQVLEILESFTASDVDRFQKYMRTEFFNNNENLVEFTDILFKGYNHDNQRLKNLTTKELSKDWKLDESTIRDWYLKLLPHLEKYLAILQLETEKFAQESLVMKALQQRKTRNTLNSLIKRLENKLDEFSDFHQGDLYVRFLLENMNFDIKHLRKKDINIQSVVERIDQSILLDNYLLLYYYCISLSCFVSIKLSSQKCTLSGKQIEYLNFIKDLKSKIRKIVNPKALNGFHKTIITLYEIQAEMALNRNLFKNFVKYKELLSTVISKLDTCIGMSYKGYCATVSLKNFLNFSKM